MAAAEKALPPSPALSSAAEDSILHALLTFVQVNQEPHVRHWEMGDKQPWGTGTWQASLLQGVGQSHADLCHAIALQQRVARGAPPLLQQWDRQGS